MALTWANIRSLAIFFGPILLPKAIGYYKSLRAARARANLPIVAVPAHIQGVLALLASTALFLLVRSTPFFAPENVFQATQSRLQINTDVLFNRLRSLRPDNVLTPDDEALRSKFVNLESRLLYFQYGPDVLAACPFCSSDDPGSYFYYALPALLAPHVLNLLVLAAATSRLFSGHHGPRWRPRVTLAVVGLALLDVYLLSAYDARANAAALRLSELDFYFWSARALRLVALAALDAGLAFVLYLSSTNRAFSTLAASPAARVDGLARGITLVRRRVSALYFVRSATAWDENLRSRSDAWWARDARFMGEVMQEPEVAESVNDAIGSGRVDLEKINSEAEGYVRAALQPPPKEGEAPVTMVG
ncbi:hypothetical protein SODALDRAFT_287746 [Sodiomyces alkalinus F11]|uniref:Uncharacterized protein n=1 Tax=Sodiomyces alkalinus (strain CBS 110278 / VKM F-3762 / F11) TaxID=1314773 RepID=A0A3N2Q6R5_SODAK|nr:hypothetical protein SODALDRAFT_287746 [Sodiomyces alkalinus F11]ROT42473.1 hypothetical protein SODALDRAFT_287746 [Sodiomyces alkalinus F11]